MIKVEPKTEFVASVMRCAPNGYPKITISRAGETILEQTCSSFEMLKDYLFHWVMSGEIPLSVGQDIEVLINEFEGK